MGRPSNKSAQFIKEREEGQDTRMRIFLYIIEYKRANDGVAPSMREIGENINMAVSVIHYHLNRMAAVGTIRFVDPGQPRSIVLPGGHWEYNGEN